MKPALLRLGAVSLILFVVFVASYTLFSTYSPKILKQLTEVKGAISKTIVSIPYTQDAKSISEDTALGYTRNTFETSKSVLEVELFYDNVLIGKGWKLEEKNSNDTLLQSRYSKDRSEVSVQAIREPDTNHTIVSVAVID